MEAANRTKRFLAQTLKEMIRETPLRKVTVKDLCARCKVNRGTFYYHFRDIQDLINWIYHTEVILPARDMIEQMDLREEFSVTSFIMAETYRSREFYTQAIQMQGQNSLQEFMLQESLENWRCLWRRVLGKDSARRMEENGSEYVLNYFCMAHYDAALHWLQNGMKEAPEAIGRILDTASLRGLLAVWAELSGGTSGESGVE